jgi:hypothetical protein
MEWIILFITSWIILFFLVDWKRIKVNIWCGITAITLQKLVDYQAINNGWYSISRPIIDIAGSSLLFIVGPVLTIGVLLAQYHPTKKWMIVLNVFVLTALYSAMEYLLMVRGALNYLNWEFSHSVVVNFLAMVLFSWFTMVLLKKKGESSL